ncbi:N-acetyl-D-Glu racemase DgcA [Sphingomonas colocasiae]|uniref:Dipeptide epimerase n=1 Tax=Sphingomonas colocasiae TaxID=1848973 RepID=A0ABS7PMG2_9SPHN|nr:N-acetyl-D-Glu racemase DgcA [Sphingomonas colocasiae]MBY8822423.1 dipeptide epimerase [Sphingomonas colocasiae]
MTRKLDVQPISWPLKEPFAISRGVQTTSEVVVVRLHEQGVLALGEAAGVDYHGETPESMQAQIEAVRGEIEAGAGRQDLLSLLPPGGARNALDGALWDLEAKLGGTRAWEKAGVGSGGPITTAITIGIRDIAGYEARARELHRYPWIKIKVAADDPIACIEAVHRGAPSSRLVVDPNQAWSVEQLKTFAPHLAGLGVALLEQPVPVDGDDGLIDFASPVPICADEAIDTVADLPHLKGRYDFVNIKLDKTGGLTAALELARAAQDQGFKLMVGCMVGGSVAMAPAMILGQICEIRDLDGPLLQSRDWDNGIVYEDGAMTPPWPDFWG